MRRFSGPATILVLAAACRGPTWPDDITVADRPPLRLVQQAQEPHRAEESIDYEHVLDTGIMLRPPEDDWGAHLMLPVTISFTQFDLKDISLDDVATLAMVPTVELIVPLDECWTLLPFAGIGGAVQLGDGDLVGGQQTLGLVTGGVEVMRWQPFAERYTSILRAGARYNAVLTSRNGLLGDWGNFDLVAELRRAYGEDRDESRFEPGVYAQGLWFWDPIELEIEGVTPKYIDRQLELGLSFGSTKGFEFLGISLPRVSIGFRFGGDLEGLQIHFGRL